MGQEASKTTSSEDKKSNGDATVRVALITGIVTIIVALLSSPLLAKLLESKPTPSPVPPASPIPVMETVTPVQVVFTATSFPEVMVPTTSIPLTNSPVFTPTGSNLAPGMRVIITASRTSGKAPLNINFNAGGSYLLTDDGTVIKCGACSFTWSIRLGANFIYGPENKDATFSFTFQKKGSYFVIAKVCRNAENEVCGATGIYIVAN